MKKASLEELKKKLKKEKRQIEKELKKIAKEGSKQKESWLLRFPKFNGGESGSGALEKGADEVEEYTTLLPIKHNFQQRLKEIDLALEKMKKGKYGICEKCGKEIETELLKAYPETRFCQKCKINFK